MLLKKIKIAGFKSFVDPTVISMPSHLIAVVGPNGCGKSNIIDAVCWVMGENSAKNLRGESLADVIFNGSTGRKPVGQASVELIFDNQDGSLTGEYAAYAEISIKRVLARDADSHYYLNGTRCRRKDIVDIFLGTGLGPRSYSIIGQNMISRLIEAKPDDMRVYLEEAAGISKYKERRRETENRIQHTKDNLARLNDVRSEIEKQLNHLKRQANAAEKFQGLKQEERTLRSQWIAIQWRQLDARLVQHTLQIQQQETGLESRQTDLSQVDRLLEQHRDHQHLTNETLHEVQRRFYAAGNDITRVEQDIRHHQERFQQWDTDLNHIKQDWQTTQNDLDETQEQINELMADVQRLEPESQAAAADVATQVNRLAHTEELMQDWQTGWDEFHQQQAKTTQTAHVEQTRIQHLDQKVISLKAQQIKLQQAQADIQFTALENDIAVLSQQATSASGQVMQYDDQLTNIRDELTEQQTLQQQTQTELDQARSHLQQLRGQHASLKTLQQTALGQRNHTVVAWLEKHQLDKQPRLAQEIQVESGWELAVEKVLGSSMQAVCVDTLADAASMLDSLPEGSVSLFAPQSVSVAISNPAERLLSKVKAKFSLESMLAPVYIADSLAEAFNISTTLAAHESVITREGVWLNAAWLRVSREKDPAAGVFTREQELKQMDQKISDLVTTQATLEEKLIQTQHALKELEKQREQVQQVANQHRATAADTQAQCKIKQARLAELQKNAERIHAELNTCGIELQQAQQALDQSRAVWQQAMSDLEQLALQRDTLQHQREQLKMQLQTARDDVHQTKELAHQLEMRLQTSQSQRQSLQQTLLRLQAQLTTLDERKTHLQQELAALSSVDALQETLQALLNQRLSIEGELNTSRKAAESVTQELKTLESRRHEIEHEIARFRDFLETLRVDWQGLKVKSETLVEQMAGLGLCIEDVIATIPADAIAEEWQAQLEQIALRITRLGPINLVAIEEYATYSERQEYLDKQCNDLQEGLITLENAIEKIDKETRMRFRETYDLVNLHFQALFPQVFGGGKAYLELTNENLLDAGVTVMACPPGKRNSTIHLLSGGEKAMTAIALVFSIFHLNPAPFCLLDEVDAPLDDANIGRFCQLVKTMAQKTQFIFISHNKLAIEMAQHLIGVTMHEPGVSRLVSVSVEEAVSLAES